MIKDHLIDPDPRIDDFMTMKMADNQEMSQRNASQPNCGPSTLLGCANCTPQCFPDDLLLQTSVDPADIFLGLSDAQFNDWGFLDLFPPNDTAKPEDTFLLLEGDTILSLPTNEDGAFAGKTGADQEQDLKSIASDLKSRIDGLEKRLNTEVVEIVAKLEQRIMEQVQTQIQTQIQTQFETQVQPHADGFTTRLGDEVKRFTVEVNGNIDKLRDWSNRLEVLVASLSNCPDANP
ncbi:hypothetical protein F4778DRAFT_729122 [Xylariomycetidae sp. FL2044]|nr:hypothetical protein F4778DRAFT_729122 [Xylariomycetidae sp. FL2044]